MLKNIDILKPSNSSQRYLTKINKKHIHTKIFAYIFMAEFIDNNSNWKQLSSLSTGKLIGQDMYTQWNTSQQYTEI